MLSFMTVAFVSVLLSIMNASISPYLEIFGPIPFVIGYTLHFLLLLVAIITNIELFKSDNIEAVEEVKNLNFLTLLCDFYNFLIGLGVFCFGLKGSDTEVWAVTFLGLAYAIISISPPFFRVIFYVDRTMVGRFLFRALMLILH